MKGMRTVAVNVGIAALTAALQELAGVNWVEAVGPVWAMAVVAAINIGMRAITTTAIGKSS